MIRSCCRFVLVQSSKMQSEMQNKNIQVFIYHNALKLKQIILDLSSNHFTYFSNLVSIFGNLALDVSFYWWIKLETALWICKICQQCLPTHDRFRAVGCWVADLITLWIIMAFDLIDLHSDKKSTSKNLFWCFSLSQIGLVSVPGRTK